MRREVPPLLVFAAMTGKPHRPSSIDGQSPVFVFVSSPSNRTRLTQEIARRYARRLSPVAIARTVRQLVTTGAVA